MVAKRWTRAVHLARFEPTDLDLSPRSAPTAARLLPRGPQTQHVNTDHPSAPGPGCHSLFSILLGCPPWSHRASSLSLTPISGLSATSVHSVFKLPGVQLLPQPSRPAPVQPTLIPPHPGPFAAVTFALLSECCPPHPKSVFNIAPRGSLKSDLSCPSPWQTFATKEPLDSGILSSWEPGPNGPGNACE